MDNTPLDYTQVVKNPDGTPVIPITREQVLADIESFTASIATQDQTIAGAQQSKTGYQAQFDMANALLATMPA